MARSQAGFHPSAPKGLESEVDLGVANSVILGAPELRMRNEGSSFCGSGGQEVASERNSIRQEGVGVMGSFFCSCVQLT